MDTRGRARRSGGGLAVTLAAAACLGAPALAAERPCASPAAGAHTPADGLTAGERFALARRLAQDGRYRDAIGEYRRLSQDHPRNVDYVFGEAQALHWSGRDDCALRLVSRARELAPDYEDVWKLEYRLLRQGGGPAERIEAFHAEASARFPGAPWLRPGRTPGANWRWETGINREALDNGAHDWQNLYAHLDRRSPNDLLLSLRLTEHRRFSRTDEELALGAGFKPAPSWTVTTGLTLSRNAAFLPQSVIDAGASRQLGNGWVAGLGLRHRRYAQNDVRTWGVSVERYFGNFRAAWHVDTTHVTASSSFTYRGVLDYYARSGSRYGLTLAAGDEVEIVAPGRLLEMQITAVALGGSHPLSERLSILWRVGTHRQDSFYRRNHAGLSLAGEF